MLPALIQPQTQLMESQLKQLENHGLALKKSVNTDRESLEKAAHKFESFMMGYMYKEMYKAIPKSDMFGRNDVQNVFMGMYMDEIAKKANASHNGLATQLIKQYEHLLSDDDQETDPKHIGGLTQAVSGAEGMQQRTLNNVFKDFNTMMGKLEEKVSSDYGMRQHPVTKQNRMHGGIDVALTDGEKVLSPSQGEVIFAGEKGNYGNAVILDHGFGITSLYAHLSEITVKKGEKLSKYKQIGNIGSTGLSTGPHLHFEVHKDGKSIDPEHLSLDRDGPNKN